MGRQQATRLKQGSARSGKKTFGKREYKKNSKQHTQNSISAAVRRGDTLLDVPRLRLQKHRKHTHQRDELDMDAAVVPVRHTCPDVPRREMATDA